MYRRWISMWGFPTIKCYGRCGECPVKFNCYVLGLSEYLEVTPEDRFTIRSSDIPDGV